MVEYVRTRHDAPHATGALPGYLSAITPAASRSVLQPHSRCEANAPFSRFNVSISAKPEPARARVSFRHARGIEKGTPQRMPRRPLRDLTLRRATAPDCTSLAAQAVRDGTVTSG